MLYYHEWFMPLLVNGELIDDEAIRQQERVIRPRLEEAMAAEDPRIVAARVREWARENLIEQVVLRQAALADPAPAGDDAGKDLEIPFRVERLLNRITEKIAPPKPKDISAYYVKNRDSFRAPAMIRASHIVKNVDEKTGEEEALAAIREVEEKLRQGGDFAQLADQWSDCPGRGGDLGFFPPGQMVPEFDKVVFALEPGQASGIFRTSFGFHIATVHERRPAGVRSLQEVREEIAQTLHNQKRQRLIEQFLDRLIAGAKVEEVRP